MILVDVHYTVPLSKIDEHLVEHRSLLLDLARRDILICSGPKKPRTGGLILLNVESISAAQNFLSADPFFRNNLAVYTYTEFTPVKCADAFGVFLQKKN